MPARNNARSSGPSALEAAALPHAVRCWEAEVENARRLGTRVQVLLSLASAMLGILFLRGTAGGEVSTSALRWVVALLVGVSGTLVFAAIVVLLRPSARHRARPLASHGLGWPTDRASLPQQLSVEAARSIAWARTIRAAAVLQRAN